jgi:hypothetical protein
METRKENGMMQTIVRTDARERETGRQIAECGDADARRAWEAQMRDCAEAECFLGVCHDFGEHGLAKDYLLARYWYERAARNGDANAMANLGYMYAHGHGLPVDGEKAVKWYTLASANGSYLAMGNLAYLYLTGIFVGKANPEKAVQLYEKVVEMEPQAECYKYDLGTCYENGTGTAVDMERAIALYQDAARLGSGLARKALKRLGISLAVQNV